MAPFTEEKFEMQHNKTPNPNGFPTEFYQSFWDVKKENLMQMFHDLHTQELPLFCLNFSVITLIPKVHEAKFDSDM